MPANLHLDMPSSQVTTITGGNGLVHCSRSKSSSNCCAAAFTPAPYAAGSKPTAASRRHASRCDTGAMTPHDIGVRRADAELARQRIERVDQAFGRSVRRVIEHGFRRESSAPTMARASLRLNRAQARTACGREAVRVARCAARAARRESACCHRRGAIAPAGRHRSERRSDARRASQTGAARSRAPQRQQLAIELAPDRVVAALGAGPIETTCFEGLRGIRIRNFFCRCRVGEARKARELACAALRHRAAKLAAEVAEDTGTAWRRRTPRP